VKEVFIARRLNKWGRRFGVVRFFDVGNAVRLEKELDQIYIGDMKLYVNIPKYRRFEPNASGASLRENKKPTSSRWQGQESGVLKGRGKREGEEERGLREKKGSKSFAEIVKGGSQQEWKGPIISTQKVILPWMKSSAIGQFNEEFDFKPLEEEFLKGGMSMIKVPFLGDKLAMLTPRVGESFEDLTKLNKAWFDSVFDRIDPWTENHVAGHKFVWVRCCGIPIILWSKDCFSKVVGEKASLVSIDNSTLLWENLEYARLQVRVQKNHNVRLAKGMRINGQVYSILIEEETLADAEVDAGVAMMGLAPRTVSPRRRRMLRNPLAQ